MSSIEQTPLKEDATTVAGTPLPSEASAIEDEKPKGGILKAFSYASRKDIIMMVIATICAIGQGAVQPINMLFLGDSINAIGSGDMGSAFDVLIRNFAIIAAIGFALGTVAITMFEYCAENQVALIKRHYLHGILKQEIGYYDTQDPGSLATDIEQSCVKVRDGIGMKFGLIFQMTSQFVSGYVVALVRGWKLALVMTAVVPIIGATMTCIMLFLRKSVKRSEEAYNEGGSIAEEIIPAMRTVAAFGLEQHFIDAFGAKIAKSETADKKSNTLKALSFGAMFFILICSYALGWWYGTTLVIDAIDKHGDFTMGGKVITVFSAIMIASFSLGQVGPNVSSLASAAESVQSVVKLSKRESPIDPYSDQGQKEKGIKGHIKFNNVRFAYPSRPDRDIYSNVSFEIKPGETVALVGASGCGKSTVIQLIERFYDATGGVIELDGQNIQNYNLQTLRNQMALVSQEPKLFTASVKDNIVCGSPNPKSIDEQSMTDAAKSANAHDFVMTFPLGYDTSVGQAGSLLSGGQKQRVAIARAIIRDPAILILDEATSALDNESEKVVQKALDDLVKMKKRTTIIIAHRLTTIRTADKIIVFDNPDGDGSKVIECGSHEELIAIPNGTYRALVEAQQIIATEDQQQTTKLEQRLNAAALTKRMSKQEEVQLSPGETHRTSRDAAVHRYLTSRSKASRTESKNQFGSQVYGSRVSLLDDTALAPLASPRIRRLWKYAWTEWWLILVGIIGSAGAGAIFPCLFLIVSEFVGAFFSPDTDQMRKDGNEKALWLVGMACLSGLFMFTQQEAWGRMGEGLVSRMRRVVFKEMIHQDMEFFDDPANNTGHLSSVLSADCALTRGITGENLSLILQNTFTLAIAIGIAFSGNPKLAAVACAAYSLMIPAIYFQARMNRPIRPERKTNETRFNPESTNFVLNEVVTNLRPIAAYNLQTHFEEMYGVALHKESSKGLFNAIVAGVFSGLATGLQSAANCITFWYAGYLINHDINLEVATTMRTIMVMLNAGAGLGRASAFATDQKRAKAAVANMFSIIDRSSAVDARDTRGEKSLKIQGNINFEEIVFRYPGRPDNPILDDVSFSVKSGQAVALVGASGSGKSTVVQFLQRFYDVKASDYFRLEVRKAQDDPESPLFGRDTSATEMFSGAVRVEGRNIRHFNIEYLRRNMGLVSQEPVLFVGSVADNIRHGKLDATDEEVEKAAQMANAIEFIDRLPERFDTPVGRSGGQLSGGQKQRIAIARALIRDPAILLFDEATSALDPESEATVQKTLDELITGDGKNKKTSITIAHRLSTIRNADKIVIFGPRPGIGSHIVEQGTHDELMKIENGVYRHLVEISQEKK